jgi:hypothetical protein
MAKVMVRVIGGRTPKVVVPIRPREEERSASGLMVMPRVDKSIIFFTFVRH